MFVTENDPPMSVNKRGEFRPAVPTARGRGALVRLHLRTPRPVFDGLLLFIVRFVVSLGYGLRLSGYAFGGDSRLWRADPRPDR
jgi:hypothetical protein